MNKNIFKVLTGLLLVAILIIAGILGYSLIFEKESIKIDEYNFNQLKIVDEIIMNDKKFEYGFGDLGSFNQLYKSNIDPIKNCYYASSSNGNQKYIFGFQLESLLYKFKYMSNYIAYPKYDLPIRPLCPGIDGKKGCTDNINLVDFKILISNPCDEDYL